jgi:membrane protein YqaA with SNARE-associated domain
VLGGIAGWFIGHYAFDTVARPILEFYGKLDAFEALRSSAASHNAVLLLLITSGLAHLPPIKVVTILSGAANVDLGLFIVSAIVARGARFFVLGWLIQRYDEPIRHFLEKRLAQIVIIIAVAIILLFVAKHFL